MNNPLIKPNDPRFQKLPIDDEAGKNRLGDDQQAAETESNKDTMSASAFGTPKAAGKEPYRPRYESSAPSRSKLLLGLALVGLAGATIGALGAIGLVDCGWGLPLAAAVAAGTAVFLSYADQREMTLGARDGAGRSATNMAMWLALVSLVACVALAAVMFWLGRSPFPNI
jgi:hypothetical protein